MELAVRIAATTSALTLVENCVTGDPITKAIRTALPEKISMVHGFALRFRLPAFALSP